MSLFLSQQNMPFQSVQRFLRAFAPSSTIAPAQWAQEQVSAVVPGDILVIFEVNYDAWGDPTAGIGVSDGDTFKAVQVVLLTEGRLGAVAVSADGFEKLSLESFLSRQAQSAKDNTNGFYYAVLRSRNKPTSSALTGFLSKLDDKGGRANNGSVDLIYSFFQALEIMSEPPAEPLDIAAFGSQIFMEREPAPGSRQPDLRAMLSAIEAAGAANAAIDATSSNQPPPLPGAPSASALPKMPSFFSKGRASGPMQVPVDIGGEAQSGDAQSSEAGKPLPSIRPPELPKRSSGPQPGKPMTAPPLPGTVGKLPPLPRLGADSPPREDVPAEAPSISSWLAEPETKPNAEAANASVWSTPAANVPPPTISSPGDLAASALQQTIADALPSTSSSDASEAAVETAAQPVSEPVPEVLEPPAIQTGAELAMESAVRATVEPMAGMAPEPVAEAASKAAAAADFAAAKTDDGSLVKLADLGESLDVLAGGDESPPVPQIAPLPPRKKKQEAGVEAHARAQSKEPVTVKSGVAGLVSKLEQQASKASSRLESQVDEIQSRLNDELKKFLNKVETAEKRSVRSAEGLRKNLTGRMDGATNEVKSKINEAAVAGSLTIKQHQDEGTTSIESKYGEQRETLNASFDEVRERAEALAKKYQEGMATRSQEVLASLEAMQESYRKRVSELQEHYEQSLKQSFDLLGQRLDESSKAARESMSKESDLLNDELSELHRRCSEQLEQNKFYLLQQQSGQFAAAEAAVTKLKSTSLVEEVLPRLKQHLQELQVITQEFQRKLSDDLSSKSETKVAEFEPVLEEKKRQLAAILSDTDNIKEAIQIKLKEQLESVHEELKKFVDSSIEQAQLLHGQTEEKLTEVDRAVRALADPSSIEGDLELLSERNNVLQKMEDSTEKAKDEVLGTLRKLLAGLDERGKHLQEELITSMEEDAYAVRRASEQSLVSIREAIKESFIAIQTAQDERMPM